MTWLDELISLYDFIWAKGVQAHSACINDTLIEDFRQGGPQFEQMKERIMERFPTLEDAKAAFAAEAQTTEKEE